MDIFLKNFFWKFYLKNLIRFKYNPNRSNSEKVANDRDPKVYGAIPAKGPARLFNNNYNNIKF